MKQAGLVLDYAPELADQVIGGEVTLNEAGSRRSASVRFCSAMVAVPGWLRMA